MIFYHFTARESLPAIAKEGLWKGEVPITSRAEDCLNAVWLTVDANPDGHGLTSGRTLSVKEKIILGLPTDAKASFPDKRAIRFKIAVPTTDRRLVHWPGWGRKRLKHSWYETLARTGGGKEKTWWLYWGVLPPVSLCDATDLTTGNKLTGWPDEWTGRPNVDSVQAP
jgi:hypothetical protein